MAALVALAAAAAAPAAAAAGATVTATRTVTAPAQTVTAPRTTVPVSPVVPPSGARLTAQGGGAISMEGSLVAFGLIRGTSASLLVQDLAGDSKVTLNGKARRLGRQGTLRIGKALGRFYVSGTRVRLRVTGTRLEASAAGTGRFLLEGSGTFSLNGAARVAWPSPAAPAELLPPVRASGARR